MSLKNKTCHISTYSVKLFKHLLRFISPILTHFTNKSNTTGYFSKLLKTTRVVPIYKYGENANVNNYRLIFILPIFSKIFEKIVFNQLFIN